MLTAACLRCAEDQRSRLPSSAKQRTPIRTGATNENTAPYTHSHRVTSASHVNIERVNRRRKRNDDRTHRSPVSASVDGSVSDTGSQVAGSTPRCAGVTGSRSSFRGDGCSTRRDRTGLLCIDTHPDTDDHPLARHPRFVNRRRRARLRESGRIGLGEIKGTGLRKDSLGLCGSWGLVAVLGRACARHPKGDPNSAPCLP
jgi:hypothetical protein